MFITNISINLPKKLSMKLILIWVLNHVLMAKGQTTPIELTYPMSSSDLNLRCYGQTFYWKEIAFWGEVWELFGEKNREHGAGNKGQKHLKYSQGAT